MLNRFIDNLEYSSRFRILKGGKISLVVSALLLGVATANAGILTNASIVPDSNVVGAKTNYTFKFTTASEVTADNYILYAWLPNNFTFSHESGTQENNNYAINCSDVVESITVDGFPATCDAARSFSAPAPTALQISLDSPVSAGSEVVVKLKNINNSTTAGNSNFVMACTSLPGGCIDEFPSKTVSLVSGTLFDAVVNNTTSPVVDINSNQGTAGSWDGYINLNGDSSCSIATGKHYYQTQVFIPTQSGSHTINTANLSGFINEDLSVSDNFMAVYEGVFDPSNPTANLVGCNDDIDYNNNNLLARFSTNLVQGKAYTMVFTSSMSPEYIDTYLTYTNPTAAITGSGTFDTVPQVSLAYSLSGTISGLEAGETVTLSGIGETPQTISANGNFVLETPLANSATYNLTATLQNGANQFRTCSVTNGTGTINSANVSNLSITCQEDTNLAPTFSYQNGISLTPDSTAVYEASGFQTLSNGKILIVGRTATGGFGSLGTDTKFFVSQYNSDGSIDTSFGTNGKTIIALGNQFIDSIALTTLSDGKIMVSGTKRDDSSHSSTRTIFLARFNADGSSDSSFGTNGILSPSGTGLGGNNNTIVSKILSQNDGKVIVTGYDNISSIPKTFAIRFNTDGSMDTTYGTSGKTLLDYDNNYDSIFDTDGKLVLTGGGAVLNNIDYGAKITRLATDGSVDTTFGTNGITTVDVQDISYQDFRTVATQSDGKIIATMHVNGATRVYRFNTNGSVDTTFNTTGYLDLGTSIFGNNRVTGLTIDSSDNIFVTGNIYINYTSKIVKITPNGTLDTTF